MKLVKKITVICLCLILFCGCDHEVDHPNEKVTSSDLQLSEELKYEFSHGLKDEQDKLVFAGNSLDFIYEVDNRGAKVELGLMIFIDGIVQEFKVDDSDILSLYKFSMITDEIKDINIQLDPSIGQSGEESIIRFLIVLNPSVQINGLKDIGNNYSISQPIASYMIFKKDANRSLKSLSRDLDYTFIEMNTQEKESYIIKQNNEIYNKLDTESVFYYLQDNEKIIDTYNAESKINFKIAGIPGRYNFVVFENMHIVSTTTIDIKKDVYTNISGFKASNDSESLFAILIPLEKNNNNIVMQSKVYISDKYK